MSDFFIKHFRKNQALQVFIFDESKKMTKRYVIPQGNIFTVVRNEVKYSYMFDSSHIHRFAGYQTVYVYWNDATPMDPSQPIPARTPNDGKTYTYSSEKFGQALDSHVASDLLKAGKEKEKNPFLIFGVLAVLLVVGLFVIYNSVNELKDSIDGINDRITNIDPNNPEPNPIPGPSGPIL